MTSTSVGSITEKEGDGDVPELKERLDERWAMEHKEERQPRDWRLCHDIQAALLITGSRCSSAHGE